MLDDIIQALLGDPVKTEMDIFRQAGVCSINNWNFRPVRLVTASVSCANSSLSGV